tara:strand:+ start:21 stop:446 length:426 start_codon:yes stop_codon:yes gene_type:complete
MIGFSVTNQGDPDKEEMDQIYKQSPRKISSRDFNNFMREYLLVWNNLVREIKICNPKNKKIKYNNLSICKPSKHDLENLYHKYEGNSALALSEQTNKLLELDGKRSKNKKIKSSKKRKSSKKKIKSSKKKRKSRNKSKKRR